MKKVAFKLFDNEWYSPGRSKVILILWYLVNVLVVSNRLLPISSIKIRFLRIFGASIGNNVFIKPGVNIKYPWFLTVGDDSWIGENVWIDNLCEVNIGRNVCISQGAMLLTGNHDYKSRSFDLIVGKIELEDGVWIGAKSIVCPGVTCETHSILSVNSVASSDLRSFQIYRGNPAIAIRERKVL